MQPEVAAPWRCRACRTTPHLKRDHGSGRGRAERTSLRYQVRCFSSRRRRGALGDSCHHFSRFLERLRCTAHLSHIWAAELLFRAQCLPEGNGISEATPHLLRGHLVRLTPCEADHSCQSAAEKPDRRRNWHWSQRQRQVIGKPIIICADCSRECERNIDRTCAHWHITLCKSRQQACDIASIHIAN